MKDLIKKIIKEEDEWDWAKDTLDGVNRLDFIEVAHPKSNDNPKNTYRVHLRYHNSSDDWRDYSPLKEQTYITMDKFLHFCKFAQLEVNEETAESMVKEYNFYPLKFKEEYGEWSSVGEDGEDEYFEVIEDWFADEATDWNIRVWEGIYGELNSVSSWWVTFFDGEGIEHKTRLDIGNLLKMNV